MSPTAIQIVVQRAGRDTWRATMAGRVIATAAEPLVAAASALRAEGLAPGTPIVVRRPGRGAVLCKLEALAGSAKQVSARAQTEPPSRKGAERPPAWTRWT
jgi:hypothetical protein